MTGGWLVVCLAALSLEVRMAFTEDGYSQPTPTHTESNPYPQEYTQQTPGYGPVDYNVGPQESNSDASERKGLLRRRSKYPEEVAKPGEQTQEENKGFFYNLMNKPTTTYPLETIGTGSLTEGTGENEYKGIFGRMRKTKPGPPYLECTPSTTPRPYSYPVPTEPYAPLPNTPPLYPSATTYAPLPTTSPPYNYPVPVDYYTPPPTAPPPPPCIYPSTTDQKEEYKPPRKGLFRQWRLPHSEPTSVEPNAYGSYGPEYSYTTPYYPPSPTSSSYTYPTTKDQKEGGSQEKPPRKGLFSQWRRRKPYSETTVSTDYYAPSLYPAPTTEGYYVPPPPSPITAVYSTPPPTTTISTTVDPYASTSPSPAPEDNYTSTTLPPTTSTENYVSPPTLSPTSATTTTTITTESYLTTTTT